MAESSPYDEEEALENEIDEELLLLLALAFLTASSSIIISQFSYSDFPSVQDRFKSEASSVLPKLQQSSNSAVQVGISRTASELNFKDLHFDYSDQRVMDNVLRAFNNNFELLLQTNQAMFEELLRVADERGWDDKELARRLKLYYGLTPRYLKTVLAMEDALKAEGLSRKVIKDRIQKRIDQLIEHRIRLTSALIGTQVVEGSKEVAFNYLAESGQVDTDRYVKEWVSRIDGDTSQGCLSSHKMIAEIGGVFPNGYSSPPNLDVIHPCRSSIRIIKRPN